MRRPPALLAAAASLLSPPPWIPRELSYAERGTICRIKLQTGAVTSRYERRREASSLFLALFAKVQANSATFFFFLPGKWPVCSESGSLGAILVRQSRYSRSENFRRLVGGQSEVGSSHVGSTETLEASHDFSGARTLHAKQRGALGGAAWRASRSLDLWKAPSKVKRRREAWYSTP